MSTTIEFDLDRFIRTSGRVDLSEVEWHRATEHPLTPEEIRVVRYMMDIESHTVIFLRDLLGTPCGLRSGCHRVPIVLELRGVLARRGVQQALRGGGVPVAPDPSEIVLHDVAYPTRRKRVHSIRQALGVSGSLGRLGTLIGSVISDREFIAIPMTWGMVNELTTARAHRGMVDTTRNVTLEQILRAIGRQERRRFAFYKAQAAHRLRDSARAPSSASRWITCGSPWARGSAPKRTPTSRPATRSTTRRGVLELREMDAMIAALPDLEGTAYLQRAARAAAARSGLAFGRERPRIRAVTPAGRATRPVSPEGGPGSPRAYP